MRCPKKLRSQILDLGTRGKIRTYARRAGVRADEQADVVRERPPLRASHESVAALHAEPNPKPPSDTRSPCGPSYPDAGSFDPTRPSGNTCIPCRTVPPPAPESSRAAAAVPGDVPREVWRRKGDRTPAQVQHPSIKRTPLYKIPLPSRKSSAQLRPPMKVFPVHTVINFWPKKSNNYPTGK